MSPRMPFSTEPHSSRSTVSPNIETRRRRFDLHSEAKVDTAFLSDSNLRRPKEDNNAHTVTGNSSPTLFQQSGASQHIKSPRKHRLWSKVQSQTAQMDVQSTASQSDCFSKDYSCQLRDIDQKMEASQRAHRLNRLQTCLVAPQTQEASRPATVECTTPQRGSSSKPDIPSQKHPSDHEQSTGQNKNHREVNPSDTGLNQTDIFAPPDHHSVPTKLLEYPPEKCVVSWPPSVARCPFDTNSTGVSSKGVFDLSSQPQQRVYQRPGETTTTSTTASLPPDQVDYSLANRAFIMEEPEDPYYVTMYYPGSVYVDMSDIVPPEVRPKPAVPAKPPNVGAPSPSSPFPPQGLGIGGGGGVSAPPPSGIPVPIGNHPPGHGASHGVGHGLGHGAGHGGGHAAVHSGGHGHAVSHSSSGGSTLLGYIGIDTIIEQMRKKTMKTGFDFNIMVVGHSGLGKSTLVNTLFKSQVSRRSAGWARDEKIPKTVEIKSMSHGVRSLLDSCESVIATSSSS
ncbi:neuronal-specific septin-3 isoform X1 [Toxotes jaculatrix]|uniref:neuronal-specific septin-3 isoform X1 n=1 Tax=Toxotes jaculatrix TaxID=941984 RepID=UPI001B3B1B59|nr:neuronal-specific septin-3 isoform X1 [Toxotes jaculatrix]